MSFAPIRLIFHVLGLGLLLGSSLQADSPRRSMLDSDPNVVYLEQYFEKPLELQVNQEAPVYSDKEGKVRIGTLKANSKAKVEAISEKAYRVRGQGTRDGIAGWVGTWAFVEPVPKFHEQMAQLYTRQMQVKKYIEAKQIAIGMTMKEVGLVLGEPTKTTVRQTKDGQSGNWEFIDYEEVRNYATRINPYTGLMERYLVSVTREEKGRTLVEFENGCVSAIEASENKQRDIHIIVPRLTLLW